MAYELIIYQAEGAPQTTKAQTVVDAFTRAGLSCVEQPDDFGHWLVLEGFESALDLTIKDGIVTGAGFRYASEDDEAIVQKVAEYSRVSDGLCQTTRARCYDRITQ